MSGGKKVSTFVATSVEERGLCLSWELGLQKPENPSSLSLLLLADRVAHIPNQLEMESFRNGVLFLSQDRDSVRNNLVSSEPNMQVVNGITTSSQKSDIREI